MRKTNTYYVYFGNRQRGCGVLTASCRELDSGTLGVGLAYCSPKDQFVKAKGRMIADARRTSRACILVDRREGQSLFEALVDELNGVIAAGQRTPKWLRKLRLRTSKDSGNVLVRVGEFHECGRVTE